MDLRVHKSGRGTLEISALPTFQAGSDVTCGFLTDMHDDYIRYSEGFCCMCDVSAIWEARRNRGGIDCGNLMNSAMQSFHCVKP